MSDLLTEHHPGGLAALDLHQDVTGQGGLSPEVARELHGSLARFPLHETKYDPLQLIALLRSGLHMVHEPLSGRVPGMDVPGMFGAEQLGAPETRDIARQRLDMQAPLTGALYDLSNVGAPDRLRKPLLHGMSLLGIGLGRGRKRVDPVTGVRDMSDIVDSYQASDIAPHRAPRAQAEIQNTLREVLGHLTGRRM